MWEKQLQKALDKRKAKGTLRQLTNYDKDSSSKSTHSRDVIDFSSNDYLGLARNKEMIEGVRKRWEKSRTPRIGSTGSRLLDGNSNEHEELERRLCGHMESQAALLFNTGYDANVSMLAVLPQPNDWVLYDNLVHASVHDGMRASRTNESRRIAFQHNNIDHLRSLVDVIRKSDQQSGQNIFVVVEAVYSMDGDLCPLDQLLEVVEGNIEKGRRCIIVDEAHAVGMYGTNGAGLCQELGLSPRIDIRLATFGKAFGSSGAAVLCSPVVRHYLINYARPLIYSTALPCPTLTSVHTALDMLISTKGRAIVRQTFSNAKHLYQELTSILSRTPISKTALVSLPPDLVHQRTSWAKDISPSPVMPLITNQPRSLASFLIQRGFLVRPICYPTVPIGMERVRICVHAHNCLEEIQELVEGVRQWTNANEEASARKTKEEEPRYRL